MDRTVLIADDHPLVRRGLCDVIDQDSPFRVVAEVADGRAAIEALRASRISVAIVDISMPELDGIEVLRHTQQWHERPAMVMLTMHDDYVSTALQLGARGYLLKERAVGEVVSCLYAVDRGEVFLSEGLSDGTPTLARSRLAELSPTELRVLKLLSEFKTSREIADVLCISYRTVQNHRQNAVKKLGLEGKNALLRFAVSHAGELED